MGARARIAVCIATMMLARAAWAQAPRCDPPSTTIPACAGTPATGAASFCFGAACGGGGVVVAIDAPAAPFIVTGLHVDGPAGSRAAGAYPIILLPGESLIADLAVIVGGPGQIVSQITWYAGGVDSGTPTDPAPPRKPKKPHDALQTAGSCATAIVASVPDCGAGIGCAGPQTCVAGACVAVPSDGAPCSDACTTGGTCASGVCTGGTPANCDDGQPCTIDACDPAAGCVHVPSDAACDDGDPCTTDRCDPVRGCVHVAGGRGACDDGDPCTVNDRCTVHGCAGTPMRCSDPYACTDDRCVAGRCVSTPVDANCDAGACTRASCRPDDPAADRRGCVAEPVAEGEPCTDDGVACTDDVCTGGTCLHVPVDTRCAASNQCTPLVCAPEEQDANADGCAASSTPVAGGTCGEDGDPCSDDLCRDATCEHVRIAEWQTCQPVQDAFRKSLALVSLARGLHAAVAPAAATAATPAAGGGMATPLVRAESDLQAVVSMLAGHGVEPTTVDGIPETPAQARARTALRQLVRTPADVRAFLAMARTRPGRQTLGPDLQRAARTRGAVLLRGTKSLKGELRRLQQVSRTFAR